MSVLWGDDSVSSKLRWRQMGFRLLSVGRVWSWKISLPLLRAVCFQCSCIVVIIIILICAWLWVHLCQWPDSYFLRMFRSVSAPVTVSHPASPDSLFPGLWDEKVWQNDLWDLLWSQTPVTQSAWVEDLAFLVTVEGSVCSWSFTWGPPPHHSPQALLSLILSRSFGGG